MTLDLALNASFGVAEIALRDRNSYWEGARPLLPTSESDYRTLLEALFTDAGKTVDELSRIVVGSGPGSFTALRASYAFVKGLAVGLRIPVIECHSHVAALLQHGLNGSSLAVLSAASKRECFVSRFEPDQGAMRYLGTIFSPLSDLLRYLEKSDEVLIVGGSPDIESALMSMILDKPVVRSLGECAQGLFRHLDVRTVDCISAYNHCELSAISPAYGREVTAKTIAERSAL